jgi:hypothetical protein
MAKAKKSGFDFFDDLRATQEKVEELTGGDFFKLKEGQNVFVLLRQDGVPILQSRERHGINICPGEEVCKGCMKVIKEGKRGNKDFVQEWKLKPAGYFWACKYSCLKLAGGVQRKHIKKLQVSGGTLQDIITDMLNGRFDPSELEDARPLVIKKKKTTGRYPVKYEVSFWEGRDISEKIPEGLIDSLPLLADEEYLQPASNKEILDAMAGRKRDSSSRQSRDDYKAEEVEEEEFADEEEFAADTKQGEEATGEGEFEDDLNLEGSEDIEDPEATGEGELTEAEEEELLGAGGAPDPPRKKPAPPRRKRTAR